MKQPERWLVLRVASADPDERALVAEALLDLGATAVEERGDEIVTYLAPPPDPDAFAEQARMHLADWLDDDNFPRPLWHWQPGEDWAREWKRGLAPREIGSRIVVKPTWAHYEAAPGQLVIDIDPEMAFGTGEHATTRGCLRLLERVVRPGDAVLDVGSGSGILSIAAVRLGARSVVAVEMDADANLNARDNFERNGAAAQVRLIQGAADPALLAGLGIFDVVAANILSGVIRPLLPALRAALGTGAGGRLVVSGILEDERPAVVGDAICAGFRVARTDEEDGWWSAILAPRT